MRFIFQIICVEIQWIGTYFNDNSPAIYLDIISVKKKLFDFENILRENVLKKHKKY